LVCRTNCDTLIVFFAVEVLIFIVGILLAVAFFTLFERKILGLTQRRLGPNKVIFWGILQPVLDGLKLLTKELFFPQFSSI
jgi:NADH:ubiquinone oxidoreductase subunit H